MINNSIRTIAFALFCLALEHHLVLHVGDGVGIGIGVAGGVDSSLRFVNLAALSSSPSF